jgi:hypothetical protein
MMRNKNPKPQVSFFLSVMMPPERKPFLLRA